MKQRLAHFFRSFYGQGILFALLFAFFRWLWTFAFFNGFTGGFEQLAHRAGVDLEGCCVLNPFHSWSIFFASYCNPVYALVVGVSLFLFFAGRKYFPENKFTFTRTERIFFALICMVIGWELATYDYNYYLDSGLYVDRILLLLLPFIIYRFPQLLVIYISFALAYRAQFNYPVDGFPMFDKRLLFDLLMAAVVYQYCRLFNRGFKIPVFFFAVCIVAAGYFMSGMKKIWISPHGYEWVMKNDPVNLFNNVHLRGWLACAGNDTIHTLRGMISAFGGAFQWVILILELGAVFFLRNRKVAIVWLGALIFMHAGIFIFGSMFFWKWMVVDALLIVIFVWKKNETQAMFGDRKFQRLSIALIVLSFLWLKPIAIGWFDTPLNQFFTYEVETADGHVYQVDKNEMNPYHQWFQYDHFLFLLNHNTVPLTGFGYTEDYALAQADTLGWNQVVEHTGTNSLSEEKRDRYEEFIQSYFLHRNQRIARKSGWTLFAPPHHLHTETCTNAYDGTQVVTKFRVTWNVAITNHNNPQWVRQEVVDEIAIPTQ